MAITTALSTSFKVALLNGDMDFSSDTAQTFKIALYTSDATLNASTTVYSTSNEVSGTGYTAGGQALTIAVNPTADGTTAYIGFDNVTWNSASFTTRGALIYKADGVTNPAVAVLDFGADQTVSTGNFTVQLSAVGAGNPVLQIA